MTQKLYKIDLNGSTKENGRSKQLLKNQCVNSFLLFILTITKSINSGLFESW